MSKEFDPSVFTAQKEKKGSLRRLMEVSGVIDGGVILYGLVMGSALAVALGLTGLIAKFELGKGRK